MRYFQFGSLVIMESMGGIVMGIGKDTQAVLYMPTWVRDCQWPSACLYNVYVMIYTGICTVYIYIYIYIGRIYLQWKFYVIRGEKISLEAHSRLGTYSCSVHVYSSVLYRFTLGVEWIWTVGVMMTDRGCGSARKNMSSRWGELHLIRLVF
jgi:hypothetical protein